MWLDGAGCPRQAAGATRRDAQTGVSALAVDGHGQDLAVADNQTAGLSHWDDNKLSLELAELQGLDFDLSLTGFSADELTALLAPAPTEGESDPDAVPEPPDEAITQAGDLWLLGRHRLLCGDSSKSEDVDCLPVLSLFSLA
jgi:hypothetical protein